VTSASSLGSSASSRETLTDRIASVNKVVQQLISRIILCGGCSVSYIYHLVTTPTTEIFLSHYFYDLYPGKLLTFYLVSNFQ
jgi:hypothetical protein